MTIGRAARQTIGPVNVESQPSSKISKVRLDVVALLFGRRSFERENQIEAT